LFDKTKFEELLVANWAKFIDSRKLMNFVNYTVQQNKHHLATITDYKTQKKSQVTISQFFMQEKGFALWIEFLIPLDGKFAEGTIEAYLSMDDLIATRVLGTIYS
jgi:hypothetical protein